MSEMSEMKELMNLCKASVSIEINVHKDYYQTVSDYIESETINVSEVIKSKMVELDTTITIYAHPDTPVGFYKIYHYDLNEAIKLTIKTIKNERKKT